MKKIIELSFKEISTKLKKGEISCLELMNETIAQIEEFDSMLNCFLSLEDKNELLKKAKGSDKRWKNNENLSLIDGIPIAIKDNIHCTGLNTTCGSNILKNYSAFFNASVIEKIKNKGGIIIGKT